jgi:tetratricopeptide (TPR) repeat protein
MDETGPKADFWLHVALLRTAQDEPEKALEAYRSAVDLAENDLRASPTNTSALTHVAQTKTHLGMELWKQAIFQQRAVKPDLEEANACFHEAKAKFAQAYAQSPNEISVLQQFAWLLLFCPDKSQRSSTLALQLAQKLNQETHKLEAKGHPPFDRPSRSGGIRPLFTLGLAYCRSNDLQKARSTLRKSLAKRFDTDSIEAKDGDAYEWFVLALVEAKARNVDAAAKWHKKAIQCWEDNRYGEFEFWFLNGEVRAEIEAADRVAKTQRR